MSSTRSERTGQRVLDAAADLFLERGYHGVGLESVAEAAGVTRQTVYNLFGSKSGLLAAMTTHVEARAGLPEQLARVRAQTDAMSMLRAMLDAGVVIEPRVRPYSSVVYAARIEDPMAAELWRNRMGSRYMGMTMVMSRLDSEGLLREGVTVEEAADVAWSLMSPHHFEYLVVDRGWTMERYRRHLEDIITRALLKPKGRRKA